MRKIGLLILVALIAMLMSCSATWHVERAMKKDPLIFETTQTEKVDTVTIPVKEVDTLFIQQRDTLIEYIQKDSLGRETIIKYKWNTLTDSVFISADCPDPEIVTKTITKTNTITLKPTIKDLLTRFWWIMFIIVLFLVIPIIKKLF